MKNKKVTYLLGLIVIAVWGIIIYRIFDASSGSDDPVPVSAAKRTKEPYNDYSIPKDTTHLLLNYRDPFGISKQKDTAEIPVRNLIHKITVPVVKPVMNWSFIKYSGYILNPGSKKLIALVTINGQNTQLAEGETKLQVKLLRNLRDSIRISYEGKTKFIRIKSTTL
jgi:hypothetical protein